MRVARGVLALHLCIALAVYAQGNDFKKVRYNGGTVSTKVDPKNWDNELTVNSDLITFKLKDGQKIEIPSKSVTSLSYGEEAHRRVGTMIALAFLSPVALFGLFHKTRLHFIGIQYKSADNKSSGLLLQGDKDNYRAILVALQSVSGVAVAVAEKDREFIPVGLTTTVTKEPEQSNQAAGESSVAASKPEATGTVQVTSIPDGADVYSDGAFVGNAPSSLKLTPGKHTIRITQAGYQEWSREITVQAGSEIHLNATLEK